MIVVVKGKSKLACLIGICEALIWFLIVREALLFQADSTLGYLSIALSYAGGFAMGTLVGSKCAEKFINTNVNVQVVTSGKNEHLLEAIKNAGYAMTIIDINTSLFGKKKYMIWSEIKSSQLDEFKELVYYWDEKAFISVQETKVVYNGYFKK
jgi:uncharacterized protein YebE (UPF0316 family)